MDASFAEAQAQINAVFESGRKDSASLRVLGFARRGVDAPETLNYKELQQVCYALIALYSSKAISQPK